MELSFEADSEPDQVQYLSPSGGFVGRLIIMIWEFFFTSGRQTPRSCKGVSQPRLNEAAVAYDPPAASGVLAGAPNHVDTSNPSDSRRLGRLCQPINSNPTPYIKMKALQKRS